MSTPPEQGGLGLAVLIVDTSNEIAGEQGCTSRRTHNIMMSIVDLMSTTLRCCTQARLWVYEACQIAAIQMGSSTQGCITTAAAAARHPGL
jgi:hypothetical protein